VNAKPLAGRTALVTGASRGLGRAIADSLAEAGATVYGSSRDQDTAEIIAKRYLTTPVVLEARSADSVRAGVAAVLEHSGGVDLLVNNAGVNVPRPAVELTETDWDDVLDTNLKGAFLLSTELARHWLAAGTRAAIVNVASQAGIVAIEERAAYGASKAGLIHLTKVLALEWAPHGIRVNAVAPTFVRTELTASTLDLPEWAAELLGRIPLGRFGEPEEIADAVTFLLADTASMITGQTLVIDGGYTIR
jgi:NAD(P)-dependent dehydrogenase (short-subunit alcohol dehydrogenase family)